jgi:phage terminase small subunit
LKDKPVKPKVAKKPKLTGKQLNFCHEYLIDFNGTQAAIRAGYEKGSARVTASKMLANVSISGYIKNLLTEANLGPEETKKLINDLATSNLNNYFKFTKIVHRPKVVKSLSVLIQEIQDQIDFEEEFANEAGLSDEQFEDHLRSQNRLRLDRVRLEIELRRNPKAKRIVDGEPVLIDVPELDMVKLVKDKEHGKIKSFTPTQFGHKVEMYAADAALTNIARIHGLFEKDNVHQHTGKDGAPLQAPITFISAQNLTEEQIEKFLNGRAGNESI